MIKKGDKLTCPHCNEMTFVKQVTEMDGWTKKGEILVCALCNQKIADVQDESEPEKKADPINNRTIKIYSIAFPPYISCRPSPASLSS